jgi:hypothetical protein
MGGLLFCSDQVKGQMSLPIVTVTPKDLVLTALGFAIDKKLADGGVKDPYQLPVYKAFMPSVAARRAILNEGHEGNQNKSSLRVVLASSNSLVSEVRPNGENPLVIKNLTSRFVEMSLMGMTINVSLNYFKLDYFVYHKEQRETFQNIKVSTVEGQNPKTAHLLHLMLDEMAVELLVFKYRLKALGFDFDLSVLIGLEDAWEAVPEKEIVSAVTPGEQMNSSSRYLLLTGTPSYYTQFGFNVETEAFGDPYEGVNLKEAKAANVEQFRSLRGQYGCMQTLSRPIVYNQRDSTLCHKKMLALNSKNGNRAYEKIFVWGGTTVFIGAHGQSGRQYSLGQYMNEIIGKGKYPELQTIHPVITFVSTDQGRKRKREEHLGIFAGF